MTLPQENRSPEKAWVTGLSSSGRIQLGSESSGLAPKTVQLRCGDIPRDTVAKECLDRAAAGQCVLWICNTVDAAIAARRLLACHPIRLVNAFDAPVNAKNGSGFLKPSVARLEDYRDKMFKAWGITEDPACFYPDAPAEFKSAKSESFEQFVNTLVAHVH